MDKKVLDISKDVRNGKLLEENIPPLFNFIVNQYHAFAGVKLVMHYYTFYEAYLDDGETWSSEAKEIMTKLNNMIKKNVLSKQKGNEMDKTIHYVDELRNSIMKQMKILTAYTDIFLIYEYILNRVEYRFKEENIALKDEEFEKDILRYIFDTQDNLIINEKIKEMIGQLPIRMTKQKYFDLLRDSIRLYLGADQASLDTYLYILRTSAMLSLEEGMESYYPKLQEQKTFLAHLKYKEITKVEFEEAGSVLKETTIFLERETSVYLSLQEIVNEVYALLLCEPYSGMVALQTENREEVVFSILQDINEAFMGNAKNELFTDLMGKLAKIEGVQEELSFDLTLVEDILYDVDKNQRNLTESIMLDKLLNVLLRTKDLLSSSLFIDWNELNAEKTVDEDVVETKAQQLIEELSALFTEHDKVLNRAIMANTLNKMPVFFKNHKEVMDYIRYSLERCGDLYEKTACVEIISNIMSD